MIGAPFQSGISSLDSPTPLKGGGRKRTSQAAANTRLVWVANSKKQNVGRILDRSGSSGVEPERAQRARGRACISRPAFSAGGHNSTPRNDPRLPGLLGPIGHLLQDRSMLPAPSRSGLVELLQFRRDCGGSAFTVAVVAPVLDRGRGLHGAPPAGEYRGPMVTVPGSPRTLPAHAHSRPETMRLEPAARAPFEPHATAPVAPHSLRAGRGRPVATDRDPGAECVRTVAHPGGSGARRHRIERAAGGRVGGRIDE